MILSTQITFSAVGKHFTPSKVSAPFTHAHDPGECGISGRYRGIPVPYGNACFDAPDEESDKITYLHRLIIPMLPALRKAGAEDFCLRVTYRCDSGAIGFSKEEIKMIAELECDVPIDCWICDEPNQTLPSSEAK